MQGSVGQASTGQASTGQASTGQDCADQVCAAQIRTGQVRAGQAAHGGAGSAQAGVVRFGYGLTEAAKAAGIESRLTGHSGRVGLAVELTARGASTTETMLAGGWSTARMVAHYSAGATAELAGGHFA